MQEKRSQKANETASGAPEEAQRRRVYPAEGSEPSAGHLYRSSVTFCTTPGSASAPKCSEPGAKNVKVILEYATSDPPVTSITTAEGSIVAGAGPPSLVNLALPVTRNPFAIGVTSPIADDDVVGMRASGHGIEISHVHGDYPAV